MPAATVPPLTDPAAPSAPGPEGADTIEAALMSPGQALLAAVDRRVDPLFNRVRGRRGADTAAVVLSNLSDQGLIWPLVATVKARRPGPNRRRAIVALGVAGCTSLAVNRVVKAAVGRDRPAPDPERAGSLRVRTPSSSSFPSGHALASTCAALVLADSPAQTAAFGTFALAVAASRVHLRAHHPSDVLGGLVIGGALGAALRPVVRRLFPRAR